MAVRAPAPPLRPPHRASKRLRHAPTRVPRHRQSMDLESFLTALAWVLVLEGLMPLIAPSRWRETFSRLMALRDGQLRFFGLMCVGLGLLILLGMD